MPFTPATPLTSTMRSPGTTSASGCARFHLSSRFPEATRLTRSASGPIEPAASRPSRRLANSTLPLTKEKPKGSVLESPSPSTTSQNVQPSLSTFSTSLRRTRSRSRKPRARAWMRTAACCAASSSHAAVARTSSSDAAGGPGGAPSHWRASASDPASAASASASSRRSCRTTSASSWNVRMLAPQGLDVECSWTLLLLNGFSCCALCGLILALAPWASSSAAVAFRPFALAHHSAVRPCLS
mmetsp:Transcript_109144/g.295883  ORF Transcript_109144/g.295883 Transcript_109144/m.295883 type:complete len:242 (+) Transcript_109144:703-1428(+)